MIADPVLAVQMDHLSQQMRERLADIDALRREAENLGYCPVYLRFSCGNVTWKGVRMAHAAVRNLLVFSFKIRFFASLCICLCDFITSSLLRASGDEAQAEEHGLHMRLEVYVFCVLRELRYGLHDALRPFAVSYRRIFTCISLTLFFS